MSKNQDREPIILGSSSANTCVCCGGIIPEGLMTCRLCEARVVSPKYNKKVLESELKALEMGFSDVLGVTVYKTYTGQYKIINHKEGSVCLSLKEAVDVLFQRVN